MDLVVGKEYYWLTESQHQFIHDLYGDDGCKFVPGPDGYYYAEIGSMDETDLLENDLLQTTFYSTSTQPGGGM